MSSLRFIAIAGLLVWGCESQQQTEARGDHDPPVEADSTSPEDRRRHLEFQAGYKQYWRAYCDATRSATARRAALSSLSELYYRTCGSKFEVDVDTKGCAKTMYITCRSDNPGVYRPATQDASAD